MATCHANQTLYEFRFPVDTRGLTFPVRPADEPGEPALTADQDTPTGSRPAPLGAVTGTVLDLLRGMLDLSGTPDNTTAGAGPVRGQSYNH
ncbi:hypothetical protein [Specibacter sp. NPDC078692]|uniref:hypothetical protein n=1 Tax=Specibacter sp. NPDC078692 TaxID=3155818 RepID=UPI00342214E3